tara:strand:+ start:409 stop:573 length:165 start_codon:yes stop_codon:yes gene_type:complete
MRIPGSIMGKILTLAILGRLLGLFITLGIILPNVNILGGNIFGSSELQGEKSVK